MRWKERLKKGMDICGDCEGEGCFKCNYKGIFLRKPFTPVKCPNCDKAGNKDCEVCKGKGWIKE